MALAVCQGKSVHPACLTGVATRPTGSIYSTSTRAHSHRQARTHTLSNMSYNDSACERSHARDALVSRGWKGPAARRSSETGQERILGNVVKIIIKAVTRHYLFHSISLSYILYLDSTRKQKLSKIFISPNI